MTTWTQEKELQLQRLWGTMSASEIARTMGIDSRNAIIGKAHRMGLPRQPCAAAKAITKPDKRKYNSAARDITKRSKKTAPLIVQDGANTLSSSPTGAKPLVDLNPRDCRWGVNSPKHARDHLFCSAPVSDPRTVYCDQHSMLAYRVTQPARDASQPDRYNKVHERGNSL